MSFASGSPWLGAAAIASAACCFLMVGESEAAEPEQYIGSEECLVCHRDVEHDYQRTVHARAFDEVNARTPQMRRGCEACHGAGEKHAASKGKQGDLITFSTATPEQTDAGKAACLACHERGARLHWKGSAHDWRDLACTSCHTVMRDESPRNLLARESIDAVCTSCHPIRRAQGLRNAHMPLREGAMDCTSCHQPHGSPAPALLRRDSASETCFECHADKRGPFLWEHAPVNEDCVNCHDPHGSTRTRMLKLMPPRLCQQCHIETRHPTEARLPGSRFVIGRACLSCHVNIHGSNHPSGHAFTR